MSGEKYDPLHHPVRPLAMHGFRLNWKSWGLIAAMIFGSNLATHLFFNRHFFSVQKSELSKYSASIKEWDNAFYLSDKADVYIYDLETFGKKTAEVASKLGIPREWLMAVIHQESQFNPGVANFQGSGAVGLLQFMPGTAAELGTSTHELQRMPANRQLDFVYEYLARVRNRYGDYQSLADLYLGILYPKARAADFCYTLFSNPSRSYKQNTGLDEDKDGRITASDIDRHLQRKYPDAYVLKPNS